MAPKRIPTHKATPQQKYRFTFSTSLGSLLAALGLIMGFYGSGLNLHEFKGSFEKFSEVPSSLLFSGSMAKPTKVWVVNSASPKTMQKTIDSCQGPTLVKGFSVPLVAQHNYCGGTRNLGKFSVGDKFLLRGAKKLNGSYRITQRKIVPQATDSQILKGMGDIVLQTCKRDKLLLTGARKIK
jgi:hypothetical protein